MAMTLRLSDADHAALIAEAERSGVSMHSLVVAAVRNELDRREQRADIAEIGSSIMEHHRQLLDRLAQ